MNTINLVAPVITVDSITTAPMAAEPISAEPITSRLDDANFQEVIDQQWSGYGKQNAQLSKKIYFWHNPKTQHIMQGAPPQFKPIAGYQVVECNHVHEAELWSKRLNEQDKRVEMMSKEERDTIESQQLSDARKDIQRLLNNGAVGLNRQMLEYALKECNKLDDARRLRNNESRRDSFLHVEAFEDGR